MDKRELIAQITCPCCSSFFRDPRLLPCLHTLCLECIPKCSPGTTSTSVTALECPVCHSQVSVPTGGCCGFPVDMHKSHLLDLVPFVVPAGGGSRPPECSECEARDAQWWCSTCCMFLCNDDKAHHLRVRKTASHKVATVQQLGSQTTVATTVHKQPLCSKHPQENLQLYCNTDQVLICRDCAFIDHKNHDVVFVTERSSKLKENIASLCSDLVAHREKVTNSKIEAIEECKNTQETVEKVEAEIRSEFDKIVAAAKAREALLLSELKIIGEAAKKASPLLSIVLEGHIEGCDQRLNVVQMAQEYAQQATTQFSDVEVVSVNQVLTAQMENICKSRDELATPQKLKVSLECESAAVCGAVSSLGKLVHNSAASSLMNTTSTTTTTRTLKQLATSMVPSITPRQAYRLFVDNATGKVYWDNGYLRQQLTEFQNMTNFVDNTNPRQLTLKDVLNYPDGTYQAVHNGHVYCNPHNAATMTKVRVSDGSTVATAPLPNAGHSSQSSWNLGGATDICWYVDAGGVLFVVHAPPNNGNIHITRVDPDSLAILQTWVVPRVKSHTGFAFVVCGRFYFGKSCTSRVIDGVYDITTGVYDDTYRNSLPTSGTQVLLTSWIPSTNQLLIVDRASEYKFFIFDNVAL
ncbi:E3 ubiquitin-protein ligase TRIM71 [Pelomyxa schiedti]|nr:E3 ubiquitin-protein ligase TRIM71 [Pelomyxa schiedti]